MKCMIRIEVFLKNIHIEQNFSAPGWIFVSLPSRVGGCSRIFSGGNMLLRENRGGSFFSNAK